MDNVLDTFNQLKQDIISQRDCGIVHANIKTLDTLAVSVYEKITAIDQFMSDEGFTAKSLTNVIAIDRAVEHLAWPLHQDLAYLTEIIDENIAVDLAERFIGLFDGGSTLFVSNCLPHPTKNSKGDHSYSFNPLTGATFDAGLVGCDGKIVAYIWFEDED